MIYSKINAEICRMFDPLKSASLFTVSVKDVNTKLGTSIIHVCILIAYLLSSQSFSPYPFCCCIAALSAIQQQPTATGACRPYQHFACIILYYTVVVIFYVCSLFVTIREPHFFSLYLLLWNASCSLRLYCL